MKLKTEYENAAIVHKKIGGGQIELQWQEQLLKKLHF